MKRLVASTAVFACALGLVVPFATADDTKAEMIDLKVGDKAPTFQLKDDADKTWSLSDHVGKKWVVIYFYPGDFTPGCTAQAKAFKDAMDKLTEKGVEVVGVSGDGVETHAEFKKTQKLNFPLLADEGGAVCKAFGVPFGPGASVKTKDAVTASANRDDRPFASPDSLDIAREPNKHLTFGVGPHACVGARSPDWTRKSPSALSSAA